MHKSIKPSSPEKMAQRLRALLTAIKPEYWLLIANGKDNVPAVISSSDYVAPTRQTIADYRRSKQSGRRFDVGVVWHALSCPPRCLNVDERHVLARLRDIDAKRVVVCAPLASACDLMTLGFEHVSPADGDADGNGLFIYDIANYKKTPAWLNSQHWANPERWNRVRW